MDVSEEEASVIPLPLHYSIGHRSSDGAPLYFNMRQGLQSIEHPLIVEAIGRARQKPLPPGWTIARNMVMDPSINQYVEESFYSNPQTGESCWDPPATREVLGDILGSMGLSNAAVAILTPGQILRIEKKDPIFTKDRYDSNNNNSKSPEDSTNRRNNFNLSEAFTSFQNDKINIGVSSPGINSKYKTEEEDAKSYNNRRDGGFNFGNAYLDDNQQLLQEQQQQQQQSPEPTLSEAAKRNSVGSVNNVNNVNESNLKSINHTLSSMAWMDLDAALSPERINDRGGHRTEGLRSANSGSTNKAGIHFNIHGSSSSGISNIHKGYRSSTGMDDWSEGMVSSDLKVSNTRTTNGHITSTNDYNHGQGYGSKSRSRTGATKKIASKRVSTSGTGNRNYHDSTVGFTDNRDYNNSSSSSTKKKNNNNDNYTTVPTIHEVAKEKESQVIESAVKYATNWQQLRQSLSDREIKRDEVFDVHLLEVIADMSRELPHTNIKTRAGRQALKYDYSYVRQCSHELLVEVRLAKHLARQRGNGSSVSVLPYRMGPDHERDVAAHDMEDVLNRASSVINSLRDYPEVLLSSIQQFEARPDTATFVAFLHLNRILHPSITDPQMTTKFLLEAFYFQVEQLQGLPELMPDINLPKLAARGLFVNEPQMAFDWNPATQPLPCYPTVASGCDTVFSHVLKAYSLRSEVSSYFQAACKPVIPELAALVRESVAGRGVSMSDLQKTLRRLLESIFTAEKLINFPPAAAAICRAIHTHAGNQGLDIYFLNYLLLPNLIKLMVGDLLSCENERCLDDEEVRSIVSKYWDLDVWWPDNDESQWSDRNNPAWAAFFPTTATTESSAVASARAAAVLAGDDPSRLNSEQLRNLQQEENNENSLFEQMQHKDTMSMINDVDDDVLSNDTNNASNIESINDIYEGEGDIKFHNSDLLQEEKNNLLHGKALLLQYSNPISNLLWLTWRMYTGAAFLTEHQSSKIKSKDFLDGSPFKENTNLGHDGTLRMHLQRLRRIIDTGRERILNCALDEVGASILGLIEQDDDVNNPDGAMIKIVPGVIVLPETTPDTPMQEYAILYLSELLHICSDMAEGIQLFSVGERASRFAKLAKLKRDSSDMSMQARSEMQTQIREQSHRDKTNDMVFQNLIQFLVIADDTVGTSSRSNDPSHSLHASQQQQQHGQSRWFSIRRSINNFGLNDDESDAQSGDFSTLYQSNNYGSGRNRNRRERDTEKEQLLLMPMPDKPKGLVTVPEELLRRERPKPAYSRDARDGNNTTANENKNDNGSRDGKSDNNSDVGINTNNNVELSTDDIVQQGSDVPLKRTTADDSSYDGTLSTMHTDDSIDSITGYYKVDQNMSLQLMLMRRFICMAETLRLCIQRCYAESQGEAAWFRPHHKMNLRMSSTAAVSYSITHETGIGPTIDVGLTLMLAQPASFVTPELRDLVSIEVADDPRVDHAILKNPGAFAVAGSPASSFEYGKGTASWTGKVRPRHWDRKNYHAENANDTSRLIDDWNKTYRSKYNFPGAPPSFSSKAKWPYEAAHREKMLMGERPQARSYFTRSLKMQSRFASGNASWVNRMNTAREHNEVIPTATGTYMTRKVPHDLSYVRSLRADNDNESVRSGSSNGMMNHVTNNSNKIKRSIAGGSYDNASTDTTSTAERTTKLPYQINQAPKPFPTHLLKLYGRTAKKDDNNDKNIRIDDSNGIDSDDRRVGESSTSPDDQHHNNSIDKDSGTLGVTSSPPASNRRERSASVTSTTRLELDDKYNSFSPDSPARHGETGKPVTITMRNSLKASVNSIDDPNLDREERNSQASNTSNVTDILDRGNSSEIYRNSTYIGEEDGVNDEKYDDQSNINVPFLHDEINNDSDDDDDDVEQKVNISPIRVTQPAKSGDTYNSSSDSIAGNKGSIKIIPKSGYLALDTSPDKYTNEKINRKLECGYDVLKLHRNGGLESRLVYVDTTKNMLQWRDSTNHCGIPLVDIKCLIPGSQDKTFGSILRDRGVPTNCCLTVEGKRRSLSVVFGSEVHLQHFCKALHAKCQLLGVNVRIIDS